jgi:hypothetical protein
VQREQMSHGGVVDFRSNMLSSSDSSTSILFWKRHITAMENNRNVRQVNLNDVGKWLGRLSRSHYLRCTCLLSVQLC